ncbi:MAG: type IV secretory system conjugative DNA transfer family protein [Anaerolineaceae bacterium]|nr:type IV secretory system conjugative DNA transfer family protein [Anaerolineaceae bacterium]
MESNDVKEKEGNILIDAALKLIVLWIACLILKKNWIRDLFYSTLVTLAAVFCTVSIIVYAGLKIRSVIYAAKTGGRNYKEDRRKYNMSYHELLDFFGHAEQHSMSKSDFPVGFWKEEEGIMLGDSEGHLVHIPSDAEANIFAAGTPGSGKTSGLVIPTCLRYGGSVLAVDIKGDIYNACGSNRNIRRFCPDLKDADGNNIALDYSAHFNPFADIKYLNPTEKKLFLANMALTLIPDQPGADGNYFTSTARKIFIGITSYLLEKKPDVTFPEVLHAILHHQAPVGMDPDHFPLTVFQWAEMISRSNVYAAIEQMSSLIGNNEKNVSGAYDALCTALIPFSNETMDVLLSGDDYCISAETLENGIDVYLQVSQENLNTYAPLLTMILQTFLSSFTKRRDTSFGAKNLPILVLLDEFPQLTFSYNMVNTALSTLRSKSIQCMLIAQTVAQISRKYQNDGWRALLGNCTYQVILKSNEEMTQRYFSALIGTKKDLKISTSGEMMDIPSPRTVSQERVPIFQPEDFGDLGDDLIVYYNGKYIRAKKIRWYE